MTTPLLEVTDLSVRFETDRRPRARRRPSPFVRAGPGRSAWDRRWDLRPSARKCLLHVPGPPAARDGGDQRPGRSSKTVIETSSPFPPRQAQRNVRRHRDLVHLPGADDVAQPRLQRSERQIGEVLMEPRLRLSRRRGPRPDDRAARPSVTPVAEKKTSSPEQRSSAVRTRSRS